MAEIRTMAVSEPLSDIDRRRILGVVAATATVPGGVRIGGGGARHAAEACAHALARAEAIAVEGGRRARDVLRVADAELAADKAGSSPFSPAARIGW